MRLPPIVFVAAAISLYAADRPATTPTIAERTASLRKMPGLFPLAYDEQAGKLFVEISRFKQEFLYLDALSAGVGSNDIGLDRGQPGETRIVRFERAGPKVLLIQSNYQFRASSDNPAERAAVKEAFAESVLAGFPIEAQEDGRVLIDITPFLLSDAHQIPERLTQEHQGSFKLDAGRSALYMDNVRSFPKNTEFESTLTFTGDQPGAWVRSVTPDPEAITVREHRSFVELPGAGYEPRRFDPRAGYFGIDYSDYSTPIDQPLRQHFLIRHRLIKRDPGNKVSDPVEPITYYLDPGTPEPIRSALLEGGNWWNQAFEAAGFRNAFRVVMLPDGVDIMDVRYNVIHWVHRSTRGWSYGDAITDPRTGEIIKGDVVLGSLRVRQDYLIATGLIGRYQDGQPEDPRMVEMALARLRQLAAHEIGHTLGLAHNYVASTHDRASVMDYPPPYVDLDSTGNIDLSHAYASGIGEWDKVAINYGYRQFAAGANERGELDGIIEGAAKRGLIFLSDADARPQGSAHPANHLWDSGTNAVTELERILKIRRTALEHFDASKIRAGAPMSTLEDVLAPVYFYHRYQTEAAAKVLGGLNYTYAVRGDGQVTAEIVSPAEQRRALSALLMTLQPATLALPDRILALIPPPAHEYPRTREDFHHRTGVTFDPLSAAEAAADLTVALMLNDERASRLVDYHSRDANYPGLDEVLRRLLDATWFARRANPREAEIGRSVDNVVLFHLMALSADDKAAEQARALGFAALDRIRSAGAHAALGDPLDRAHWLFAAREIEYFTRNPKEIHVSKPAELPDGPPIGCGGLLF